MSELIVANIRLGELAAVADQNKAYFDAVCEFLKKRGYPSLHDFIQDETDRPVRIFEEFFSDGVEMPPFFDGIARQYPAPKAKWLFWGWLLRDAPEQRLKPIVAELRKEAKKPESVVPEVLDKIRAACRSVFKSKEHWTWVCVREVMIDRLEGSRRAKKGNLYENIVREVLLAFFEKENLKLKVHEVEEKIEGETYDVVVSGAKRQLLMPVKTRETMGGGHAHIFTRDIFKSIQVAAKHGYKVLPIVIAESWTGNLKELPCDDFIFIEKNPNQLVEVRAAIVSEIESRLELFQSLSKR